MQKITTFLMFEGKAEEAMRLYVSLFNDARIESITYFKENEGAGEGTVMHAVFSINGQQFIALDTPIKHGFGFTPSMSLFVNCETEAEIDRLFDQLSVDGKVLMPLGAYPFSKKYGWLSDKYGVSWQLSFNS